MWDRGAERSHAGRFNQITSERVSDSTLTHETLPGLFQAADKASQDGQESFLWATRLRLWMLLLAAGAGPFVGRIGPPDWPAVIAVGGFAAALATEGYRLASRPERKWYEGRAAAESAKTLAWRYAVGGRPFEKAKDRPESEVDELFLQQLREVLQNLKGIRLANPMSVNEAITPAMRNLRSGELRDRKGAYEKERIEHQQRWYATNADLNERRAGTWLKLTFAAETAGLIAGILTVARIIEFDLMGLAAAVAASLAAWLQTKQHDTLARAYAMASLDLTDVRTTLEADRTEDEWAAFVDKAEEAISREHTLWRVTRDVEGRHEGSSLDEDRGGLIP